MKAVGIVLAGGSNTKMGELSKRRAVAAMPVAGSYRCIDFVLSNMSNSHVQKVAVLTQYNSRSLNEHLNSSKWWDFGRKQGGLYVLTPYITEDNSSWYLGTADSIYQNLDFLRECHEPYVIISSGDCVYKMDYEKLLNYHVDKKADITVAVKDMTDTEEDLSRFGIIHMDEEGRIVNFEEKPMVAQTNTVSIGVYVIRRRLLIELIQKAHEEGRTDFVQDILVRYKDVKKIFGYKHVGYWKNIATVESYEQANKDFLKRDIRSYFFKEYPNIYSKIDDLPPAKFNPGAAIKNSLISSGCIINGEVQDSILFKKVYIGNNCVIKNSIILNDVYIGDNTVIENCIVESRDTIRANSTYKGEDGKVKIVVEKSDRYIL